jgi:hypothetical protein
MIQLWVKGRKKEKGRRTDFLFSILEGVGPDKEVFGPSSRANML